MHVLIVEDDARLSRVLRQLLAEDHHVVAGASTGREGLELALASGGFDVMILDVGLPDIDGLEVARRLRATGSNLPILMLTARDTVDDRVAGLDSGADDYLLKPFAYAELTARLRALARRHDSVTVRPASELRVGRIALDDVSRSVSVDGTGVALTPREFALLECFLRHPRQVLSRDQLIDHAWPFGVAVTPNAVDAYVHYLRQKLGPAGLALRTVRGVGYRLDDG
jgi:DNA-binding response OmpR family regulator